MEKIFEIRLTDIGDDTMNAEINVGKNITPEMLEDMIAAFTRISEGLYDKARLKVAQYCEARKEVNDVIK